MHKIYSAASNLKFANRMNRTQWQPKSRVKLHFQIGGISIVFVQIGRILTCLEIIQNSAPCDQDRFKLVVLNKSFPSLWIWCYFRKRGLLPNLIQNCHNLKDSFNQKHQQRAAIWVLIKGRRQKKLLKSSQENVKNSRQVVIFGVILPFYKG